LSPRKANPKRAEERAHYSKLLTADRFREALKKCGGAGTTTKIKKALGWDKIWAANGVIRNVGKELVSKGTIKLVRHGSKVRGKILYSLPGYVAPTASSKRTKRAKAKGPKAKGPESPTPAVSAPTAEAVAVAESAGA
jgi:hypothetical protein